MTKLLLCMLLSTFLPQAAPAVMFPAFSFDELLAKSDFVAIAEPVSTTDTADLLQGRDAHMVTGVHTLFRVLALLKGPAEDEGFTVLHFRTSDEAPPNPNPDPGFIRFHPAPHSKFSVVGVQPHYLVFLKRRTDGLYEPTSGQYVAVQSFWELSRPSTTIKDILSGLAAPNHALQRTEAGGTSSPHP